MIPIFTFNNGVEVPSVGLGCWMGEPGKGEQTEIMVKTALKHGYRHFDTAAGYDNEEAVGKAIHESAIPREEIFITTKVGWRKHGDVKGAFEESRTKLKLEYIDLWLMHWPQTSVNGRTLNPEESPNYVEIWKDMEEVYREGKVKSIGVSNFSIKTLEILLKEATIVPATNQVEVHPAYPQDDLLDYCKSKGILITAYSPLGQYSSPFFTDPRLQEIAKKEEGTVAQVVLSWGVQKGIIVIPKSEKEDRMKENIQLLNLSPESMNVVNSLHKLPGYHRPLSGYFNLIPGQAFGWTYEQLGWNLTWDEEKKSVFATKE